jgi:hypothetical protein
MNTHTPCYTLSRMVMNEHLPIDSLRLEVTADSFHLLPYHHMEFATFDSNKERDTLTLSFLGHQVRIAGRNLRELAVAIQKRAVESIRPTPNRYAGIAGNDGSFVEAIEIEATQK